MCTASSGPLALGLPVDDHQPFSVRNYLAHSIEGGLFMSGIAFLAAETVLPAMMRTLGGPTWLIGLMPLLMIAGFQAPALFVAHLTERLPRMMPLLYITGIFQRLMYLVGALALFFLAADHPRATMVIVALVPLVSGICGGIGGPAWQELTSRILPPDRRASALGIRFSLGAICGALAGFAVEAILARNPGPSGFGYLHLCSFAFFVGSYVVFLLQREEPRPPRAGARNRSLIDNLRSVPALLRAHPSIIRYQLMSVCTMAMQFSLPFLALYVLEQGALPDSFIGRLVTAQMIGGIIGNIGGSLLGDRLGGKYLVLLGQGLMILTLLGFLFAESPLAFRGLFGLIGGAFNLLMVGNLVTMLGVVPSDRRPTSIALISVIVAPAMLGAAALGGVIQDWLPGAAIRLDVSVTLSCLGLGCGMFLCWGLRERR